jgi:hypothetical protein
MNITIRLTKVEYEMLKGTSKNTISPCVEATIAYSLNS